MTQHILISYASDGVNDHALDLRREAQAFSEIGAKSFDRVIVFDTLDVRRIAASSLVSDPLLDQTEACHSYLIGNGIAHQRFKYHPGWLRANCMLFKPILVHYALKHLAQPNDIVSWHDCNLSNNPHYALNLSEAGRAYLESRLNRASISFYSDTLLRPEYDIKPFLLPLIKASPTSRVLPTLKVFVFSLRRDIAGESFADQWLELSMTDNYRLPFPDIFPQPWFFRHHSPEQATAYLALCRLCDDPSFRSKIKHTFLWNDTYLPPRPHHILFNIYRRSHLRRNLALLRLLTRHPF